VRRREALTQERAHEGLRRSCERPEMAVLTWNTPVILVVCCCLRSEDDKPFRKCESACHGIFTGLAYTKTSHAERNTVCHLGNGAHDPAVGSEILGQA